MSGRNRLPSGEPRKASQKRSRLARRRWRGRTHIAWTRGANVQWQGREGRFQRDVGDGEHAEIVIAGRTYRVRRRDLGAEAAAHSTVELRGISLVLAHQPL